MIARKLGSAVVIDGERVSACSPPLTRSWRYAICSRDGDGDLQSAISGLNSFALGVTLRSDSTHSRIVPLGPYRRGQHRGRWDPDRLGQSFVTSSATRFNMAKAL